MAIDKTGLAKAVMLGFATVQKLARNASVVGCDRAPPNPYKSGPAAAHEMLVSAKFNFDRPLKIV